MAKKRRDEIGVMFDTGDSWDINAVCNGIYAIEEPCEVSSDYPSGYRRHVTVSVGSLPPHSRCVYMGEFPSFPTREPAEAVEILEAKELLISNGYRIEREPELVS